MSVDERVLRIRQKIERAKKLIRELDVEIQAFLSKLSQQKVEAKRDPRTREIIYYASADVPETPVQFALIAGDAIQNIRSSLDHLAYQLFLVGCPGGLSHRQVYFPIFDSAKKYHEWSQRKVKGMRQNAIEAINDLKPYKGGNDLLWSLHKLSNIDKHRVLITTGAAHVAHSMTPHIRNLVQTGLVQVGRPDLINESSFISVDGRQVKSPLKKGDELFRDAPDAGVDRNVQVSIQIVFGEPEVLASTMLVPTLLRMARSVEGIIVGFGPLLT